MQGTGTNSASSPPMPFTAATGLAPWRRPAFTARRAEGEIAGDRVLVLKPEDIHETSRVWR